MRLIATGARNWLSLPNVGLKSWEWMLLSVEINTDSNGKLFPIFPSGNCCQITGPGRVVSSPCPHVAARRLSKSWRWQTSIGLDDIANLYIYSLSVAVNEAAVWLAGSSQANLCLHLHFWKDLIWLGSDKMLTKLTRHPSKFEAFSQVFIEHVFVLTANLTSKKELLISATKSEYVNLLLPTAVYIWECYHHLRWSSSLSIPSQAHNRGPWPTQWCLSARRPIATHPTGAKTGRSFHSMNCSIVSKGLWTDQTYTPIEVVGFFHCFGKMLNSHTV